MGPEWALPISPEHGSSGQYAESLLEFVTSNELLRTLCGGVHILDFYTRTPDLYSAILPEEWRIFFRAHDIMDILDLLMREELADITDDSWRKGPIPPSSLVKYISDIRRFLFRREFAPIGDGKRRKISHDVARGMNVKKVHEVDHFSRYVDGLATDIGDSRNEPISHLVDFGTGQGYLPRCLASPPYGKHLIAIESKQTNIEGAMNLDVQANLAEKPIVMRNKKEFRAERDAAIENGTMKPKPKKEPDKKGERGFFFHPGEPDRQPDAAQATLQISNLGQGSIQYVEHWIWDGDLTRVVNQIVDQDAVRQKLRSTTTTEQEAEDAFSGGSLPIESQPKLPSPNLMVISLHSCGNLVHHGIRSLLLNQAVSAVALVGCCYNLMTERLGGPTYKLPSLRTPNARLAETSKSSDPHGFPMSQRLCTYPTTSGPGVRLNITARMMAVQAPQNWGKTDSEGFFTRHFYRALLQRVFLDIGIVASPTDEDEVGDRSPLAWTGGGGTAPIILGSLRKAAYADFVSYVRAAQAKLCQDEDPTRAAVFEERLGGLSDDDIRGYETGFAERKKELSVMWSLMAFSAGVIEATIVTDRWLFLREQEEVAEAWVEPVFAYDISPRNLVVVGVKK